MNSPRRLDAINFLVEMCENIDIGEFISLCTETDEAVVLLFTKT